MPDWNPRLSLLHYQREAFECVAQQRGIPAEGLLQELIEAAIAESRQWVNLSIPIEVAENLLEEYGQQWEGTNKYDSFYCDLKEQTESRREF